MGTLGNMASAARSALGYRLTGRRAPVFLSYAITYRCTNACSYCDLPQATPEVSFDSLRPLLDEFRALGLVRLGLTGGEPLLHPDVGRLLDHCRNTGVMTVMSTNGRLVAERIDELGSLDLASVSIDCEPEVHDDARGEGGFTVAVDAARALVERGTSVVLSAVLTARNLDRIDDLLALAREARAMAVFQPYFRNMQAPDPDDPLLPEPARFRAAIERIIGAKKKESGLVASSLPYLRFVARNYPTWDESRCLAGRLFFALTPDARLAPCYPMAGRVPGEELKPGGVGEAIDRLDDTLCRTPCYCNGHLENNLLFRFHPLSAIDVLSSLAAMRRRARR